MTQFPPQCSEVIESLLARLQRNALLACIMAAGCREQHPALRDPSPDTMRIGRAVYGASCARCHGARGEGVADWKRPIARGVYAPPPHDSTGHTWHHADGLLHRLVAEGVPPRGPATGTAAHAMPAFRDSLSNTEIRAVIGYLKTLWTPEQRLHQWRLSQRDSFPAAAAKR